MSTPAVADILLTVTEIATAEIGVPAVELGSDVDLRGVAGVDSVRVLRMVARIERTYDIELDDQDVFGMSTLADVAAVVHKALAEVPA